MIVLLIIYIKLAVVKKIFRLFYENKEIIRTDKGLCQVYSKCRKVLTVKIINVINF